MRISTGRITIFLISLPLPPVLTLRNRQGRAWPETGADILTPNDLITTKCVRWGVVWGMAVGDVTVLPSPRASSPVTCPLLHECSCWIPADTEESRLGANQTLWNEAALSFPLPPPPQGTPDILQISCKANCPFPPESPSNNAAIVSAFPCVHPRIRQGKWKAFLQYTLKKLNNLLSLSYLHFVLNKIGHSFYQLSPVLTK